MAPLGSPTGWCLPSPCVQWSKTTCPSAFFTPTSRTSGLYVCCTCVWVWEVGMGVCVYVRVYLNKTDIVFHSPSNGCCRFPHRLVSPLPMCSGEQFHLTVSFHPLHSQYRQHHLDGNKHRSVFGVGGGDELWMCVWVAQCRLCKVTSFIAIRSSTTVRTCFTCANLE